ncbi:MAG TPA: DUF4870 domain-containing protein [Tepidisphaeraceae bacterium]|jgi:hypothetical protein
MSDIPTHPPEGTPDVPPTPPTGTPAGGTPIDHSGTTPAGAPVYAGPAPTQDDKTMGMLAHLLGIFGFIGPLIVWLIKKDQSPFVDDQGKEALNFHLVMLIGYVLGGVLSFFCIGFLIIPLVWICSVVFSIMGAMKAKEGIAYRYPFNIRMVK